MRVPIIFFICLLMSSNNNTIGQTLNEGRKVVVLDAGHGGIDSGTVSEDGLQEKDVVLDIVRQMKVWNKILLESKYDIYLTRRKDTLISLTDRSKLVKHLKPDVFISLHCNHNPDSEVNGVELYTYSSNNLSSMYAEAVMNELTQKLGFKRRKVKIANFQVLRETGKFCPGVLLELGYLSNSEESDYLKKRKNRKIVALAILNSLQVFDGL